MALDIFSSFDDHNKVLFNWHLLMWAGAFFTVPLVVPYWKSFTSSWVLGNQPTKEALRIWGQTSRAQYIPLNLKNVVAQLNMVLALNLIGLLPYSFSPTSHLAANIGLAMPLFISSIILSATYSPRAFLAHFLPSGAPGPLSPFLVMIEFVSVMVRPLTLVVRLAANLSAGHIMMALLGGAFAAFPPSSFILILVGSFYTLFEMAVCCVQAYIFTLLTSLYLDEHPGNTECFASKGSLQDP